MKRCSFNAMTLFILVSWATTYSHFLRTVKDFSIRTLASRTEKVVVNYEEYCLFSVMLELWGASWWSSWTHKEPSFLPVSDVPLDIPARTHNEPVLLSESASLVAPLQTERRAKICNWYNLTQHDILCTSWMKWMLVQRWNRSCIFWLQYSLPNQTSRTME